MKGPSLDDRLDAIAGAPSLLLVKPKSLGDGAAAGTVIFVGIYTVSDKDQFMLYQNVPRISKIVSSGTGVPGKIYSAVDTFATGGSWQWVGFGTIGRSWSGPMIGVVYDRVLTEYQKQRVLAYLTRQLQH